MIELDRARRGHVRLRAAHAHRPTGTAVTHTGASVSRATSYKTDFSPIEEGCECYACRNFTRAYLRHLLRANEILGLRMVSVHNSHLYLKVMTEVRAAIAAGTFADYYRNFIANCQLSQNSGGTESGE